MRARRINRQDRENLRIIANATSGFFRFQFGRDEARDTVIRGWQPSMTRAETMTFDAAATRRLLELGLLEKGQYTNITDAYEVVVTEKGRAALSE